MVHACAEHISGVHLFLLEGHSSPTSLLGRGDWNGIMIKFVSTLIVHTGIENSHAIID